MHKQVHSLSMLKQDYGLRKTDMQESVLSDLAEQISTPLLRTILKRMIQLHAVLAFRTFVFRGDTYEEAKQSSQIKTLLKSMMTFH
jgi:hypothetical protein